MKRVSVALLAVLAAPAFGGYTYYFTDPMQSFQSSDWTASGGVSFTNYGSYWGAWSASDASMVSTVAVPDGTASYSVSATLHFPGGTNTGGQVSLLLRAASTFSGGSITTGYIVNFYCAANGLSGSQVSTSKVVSGTYTTLAYGQSISCSDGMVVRATINDSGQIGVFINGVY
jgi:hypothetical protein